MRRRLYLVDASLQVFRAWHALPAEQFLDADGLPVNAVHGFARFLLQLLEQEQPCHIALAFDHALGSSFRNALYPAYKANRAPAPESLKRQFILCQAFAVELGIAVLADVRYEADDLIGSLLLRQRERGFAAVVVSADKDLSQLLGPGDLQWDFARGQRWQASEVKSRYGVHPWQLADFLGLTGDASDNIPGVPGIGATTASALLEQFDSLDGLLARVDEVPFLRLRGAGSHARRLREHADLARLSRQLATIACNAPLAPDPGEAERGSGNAAALRDLMDYLRLGPMTRRRALQQVS